MAGNVPWYSWFSGPFTKSRRIEGITLVLPDGPAVRAQLEQFAADARTAAGDGWLEVALQAMGASGAEAEAGARHARRLDPSPVHDFKLLHRAWDSIAVARWRATQ